MHLYEFRVIVLENMHSTWIYGPRRNIAQYIMAPDTYNCFCAHRWIVQNIHKSRILAEKIEGGLRGHNLQLLWGLAMKAIGFSAKAKKFGSTTNSNGLQVCT